MVLPRWLALDPELRRIYGTVRRFLAAHERGALVAPSGGSGLTIESGALAGGLGRAPNARRVFKPSSGSQGRSSSDAAAAPGSSSRSGGSGSGSAGGDDGGVSAGKAADDAGSSGLPVDPDVFPLVGAQELVCVSDNFRNGWIESFWARTGGAGWVEGLGAVGLIQKTGAPGALRYAGRSDLAAVLCEVMWGDAGDGDCGPVVRCSGTWGAPDFSGYRLLWSWGVEAWWVQRWVSGVPSDLWIGFGSPYPAVGDVMGLRAVGTTITAERNGVPIWTGTDSALSSGWAGFVMDSPPSSFRNSRICNLA